MQNCPASIEALFSAALEIASPVERSDFLDQSCGGDAELRRRVEALLAADDQAGSFLGQPLANVDIATHAFIDDACDTTPETSVLPLLAPCDKPDRIGQLDQYEIIEVVGHGGMGTVLRAFDTKLSRVVALKVMAPELAASPTAVRRFLREATSAAAVVHDHVVTIYAVDDTHRPPFLVMEFVAGQTLQQKIQREGALELKTILRIGSQAAAGLAAAHKTGLIHRDVKPANILLENGIERVKITDFGLARAADDLEMTKAGMIAGTPQYMSPEQAKGESIDARSDLFSLGSVLYTMCTGRPAFRAESTMGVLKRVCEDEPRPVHEVNPEIPDWLEAIVAKLLAKDPGERFQSAAEVGELLSQHLAHLQQPKSIPQPPMVAVPRSSSTTGHIASSVRRSNVLRSRAWQFAAAAGILLCVGLALAETTGVTNVAASVIRIVRGDGTLVVEIDDPNIQVLVDGDEIAITGAGPKELRLRPGQHQLQSVKDGQPVETKLVTITKGGRDVVKVTHETSKAAQIALVNRQVWADAPDLVSVSGDGRRLVYTDKETGQLALSELATGQKRLLTNDESQNDPAGVPRVAPMSRPPGYKAWSPLFSSDGTLIAYWWRSRQPDKKELRVIGTDGGSARTVFTPPNGGEEYLSGWTPDNRFVFANLYDESKRTLELTRISIGDGSTTVIKSYPAENPSSLLSPDGKTVAYSRLKEPGSSKRSLFLIDVSTGRETLIPTPSGGAWPNAWTPDNKALLYETEGLAGSELWMIRIVAGQPHGEPTVVRTDWSGSAFGITRGGTLYYGTWSGGSRAGPRGESRIYLANVDLEAHTVTARPLEVERFSVRDDFYLPSWSPDGEKLAYRVGALNKAQHIRIVSVKDNTIHTLRSPFEFLNAFHWSADGKSFLTSSELYPLRTGVYRIDVKSGDITTLVEPPAEPAQQRVLYAASWSPDGKGAMYVRASKNAIVLRNFETNEEREVFTDSSMKPGIGYRLAPDAKQMHVTFQEKATDDYITKLVQLANPHDARELLRYSGSFETRPRAFVWTPDSRSLIYLGSMPERQDQGLWLISTDGKEQSQLTVKGLETAAIEHMAIHPSGNQLAITTAEPRKYQLWALENFLPSLDETKTTAGPAPAATTPTANTLPGAPQAGSTVFRELKLPRPVWNILNTLGDLSADGAKLTFSLPSGTSRNMITVRDLATGKDKTFENALGLAPVFSPDAKQVAYAHTVWDAKGGWTSEVAVLNLDSGAVQRTGVRGTPKDWMPDGNNILISSAPEPKLLNLADNQVRTIPGASGIYHSAGRSLHLSPDGKHVVLSKKGDNVDVYLVPIDGGDSIRITDDPAVDCEPRLSPDQKTLIFKSNRHLGRWDLWGVRLESGQPIGTPFLVKPGIGEKGATYAWDKSGQFLYSTYESSQQLHWSEIDPATFAKRGNSRKLAEESIVRMPSWSPDGQRIAYYADESHLVVITADGAPVRRIPSSLSHGGAPCVWLPDSDHVVYVDRKRETEDTRRSTYAIYSTSAKTGETTAIHTRNEKMGHLAISSDGKRLAFLNEFIKQAGSKDYLTGEIYTINMDGTDVRQISAVRPKEFVYYPQFSPDGSEIYYTQHNDGEPWRGSIMAISVESGRTHEVYGTSNLDDRSWSWTFSLQFLPSGNLIFEGNQRTRWMVPMDGSRPPEKIAQFPPGSHPYISPDGKSAIFREVADYGQVWLMENFIPPLADPK